jgi:hypothetical protein
MEGALPLSSPLAGSCCAKLWARSIRLSHDGDFSLTSRAEGDLLSGDRLSGNLVIVVGFIASLA